MIINQKKKSAIIIIIEFVLRGNKIDQRNKNGRDLGKDLGVDLVKINGDIKELFWDSIIIIIIIIIIGSGRKFSLGLIYYQFDHIIRI